MDFGGKLEKFSEFCRHVEKICGILQFGLKGEGVVIDARLKKELVGQLRMDTRAKSIYSDPGPAIFSIRPELYGPELD